MLGFFLSLSSLNLPQREKQLREIQMENIGLAKRLEHTKPVIRSDEMVNYRGDNAENLSNTLHVWNEHFMT